MISGKPASLGDLPPQAGAPNVPGGPSATEAQAPGPKAPPGSPAESPNAGQNPGQNKAAGNGPGQGAGGAGKAPKPGQNRGQNAGQNPGQPGAAKGQGAPGEQAAKGPQGHRPPGAQGKGAQARQAPGKGPQGQGQNRPGQARPGPGAQGKAQVPATVPNAGVPAQRAPGGPPGPAAPPKPKVSVAPVAPARMRRRHRMMGISFLLLVVLPAMAVFYYLYEHAQDRYASSAAFFVHREDTTPSVETVFGVPNLGGATTTPDADVLYQFIQSQRMVELADAALDLRRIYSPPYEIDPVFALDPEATLEDLVKYWERVVSLIYAPDSGLITIEVIAYDPQDAQDLARFILAESAALIDKLSQIAREDAITQAQQELSLAEERLKSARVAVAEFRSSSQFVDPSVVVAGSEGVIAALEQRLAEELVNRDTLVGTTTRDDDPRIDRADRTIQAIRERIEEERATVGRDDAAAVGAYEELLVDRQFAEQAYTAALGAYDGAVAEARRKSRYLATHIDPTRADTAIYPDRPVLGLVATLFLFMAWAVVMLVLYSLRDRR